jgi:hypothetical protein
MKGDSMGNNKRFGTVYFLNWWLIFTLICVGSVGAWFLNIFQMTNNADVTKISFIIYLLFLIFTVLTGYHTHKLSKLENATNEEVERLEDKTEISWFVSDVLLTLGLLGTILGYIYMIETGFRTLDPGNISSLHSSLKYMAVGWGTALYTTAAGLICGMLLKLQLFNITKQAKALCAHKGICSESATTNMPLTTLG